MSDDTTEPRRGQARTNLSTRSGHAATQPKRTRKTRVQAAALPEVGAQTPERDVEPVAALEAGAQPVGTEVETDNSAPLEEPVMLRPVQQTYTPPSMSHGLNLPALELIASPFHSFREIGRFQQTLSTLPGVQAVQPRQLNRGILQVRVDCRNAREMLRALSTDYPTPFSLVSHEMHQVEIAFDEGSFPQLVEAGSSLAAQGA